MKNLRTISATAIFALVIFIMQGCSFSTANLSSLETYKDKDGKDKTSSFKGGDTIYAKAIVSNNPGNVKVKFSLADPQGKALSGSEVSVDLSGDMNVASYSLPVTTALPAGSYKLSADMINDEGEKKDSKSETISIAEGSE
ncbi:MAG: hypothetical protein ACR2HG_08870 [Pyrinomonadaceae bacterium]